MPNFAFTGTYDHPGVPGATVTVPDGPGDASIWLNQYHCGSWAVDIETFGLGADMRRIKCVVIAVPDAVLVLDPRRPDQADAVQRAVAGAGRLIMHVSTADTPSLFANGLMGLSDIHKVYDTVIPARLAQPGETIPKTLEACTERYLGIKSGKIQDMFRAAGYATKQAGYEGMDIDSPAYVWGAAADGLCTARLFVPVRAAAVARLVDHPFDHVRLSPDEALAEDARQQKANKLNLRRAARGIRVDFDELDRYRERSGRERAQGASMLAADGIDPGNANHLTAHLEKLGALPADHPRTAKTNAPSGQAKHLERLNHPLARTFVAVKQLDKVESYLVKATEAADEHGRIHPITGILTAVHGRQSVSGDLPLHQLPPGARGILLADDGDTFGRCDWSAQEPRLGLNIAGDVQALQPYELAGVKIYDSFAQHLPYKVKKVVVLGGLYGEGTAKLSADLNMNPDPWIPAQHRWGYAQARAMQEEVFGSIPQTRQMMLDARELAKRHKLAFTVAGRIIPIPSGVQPWDGKWSLQVHKWINFMICGSAADEMTQLQAWLYDQGLYDYWYFGMHDEAVVSATILDQVQRRMETPMDRLCDLAGRVPVIRSEATVLGERWAKA